MQWSKQMIPTIKLSALDKLDKLRNSNKINITTKIKCTLSNLNKPAMKFCLKRNAIKKHQLKMFRDTQVQKFEKRKSELNSSRQRTTG